jgi:hypothetical protein
VFKRICALVLCLLAASPLTAPFSTLDLEDLNNADATQQSVAALQLKTAKDTATCGLPPALATSPGPVPSGNSAASCAQPLTPHRILHPILRL